MKQNRPDKPGYWWWKDYCGMFHVVEFNVEMETYHNNYSWNVEEVENFQIFSRWLGPAHPPKKVKRYNLTQEYGMAEGYRRSPGDWVRYDDIEEFLIGDDDETE